MTNRVIRQQLQKPLVIADPPVVEEACRRDGLVGSRGGQPAGILQCASIIGVVGTSSMVARGLRGG
jgi:hypothetical protein